MAGLVHFNTGLNSSHLNTLREYIHVHVHETKHVPRAIIQALRAVGLVIVQPQQTQGVPGSCCWDALARMFKLSQVHKVCLTLT